MAWNIFLSNFDFLIRMTFWNFFVSKFVISTNFYAFWKKKVWKSVAKRRFYAVSKLEHNKGKRPRYRVFLTIFLSTVNFYPNILSLSITANFRFEISTKFWSIQKKRAPKTVHIYRFYSAVSLGDLSMCSFRKKFSKSRLEGHVLG